MAFTFIEGWEEGIADWTLEEGAVSDVNISTAEAFGCTHSLYLDPDAIGTGNQALRFQLGLPGAGLQDNEYWLACAVFVPVGFTATLAENEAVLLPTFAFNDGGVFPVFLAILEKVGGVLVARFGQTSADSAAITEGVWHTLELSAEILSSPDGDLHSQMFWDGVQIEDATFAFFGAGATVEGLYVGTIGLDGVPVYYFDTLEWNESAQIGEVQPTDEEPCPDAPPSQSFPRSPQWRWVMTTLNPQTLTDLTQVATGRKLMYRLNGPAVATATVPSDNPKVNILDAGDPFVEEGVRCLLGFRREGGFPPWVIRYAGIVLLTGDAAESEDADTLVTAYDPWSILDVRPVQCLSAGPDCPNGYLMPTGGVLPGVNGMSFTATQAQVVALTLLRNTIVNDGNAYLDAGATWAGTGFYAGTIEPCDPIDINFQQGLSVGDAWRQVVSTGKCDIILRPIYDPINRPGTLCEVDIYERAGAPRYDAVFGWDSGPRSLVNTNRTKDGTRRANRVQFYQDQGGDPVALQSDAASISRYGAYWYQQFFPVQTDDVPVESFAELVLELRAQGKTVVTVSPAPERSPVPFQEYYLGDTVPVYASSKFRRTMTGFQRIYGLPVDLDDNGVETVRELLCSVDET